MRINDDWKIETDSLNVTLYRRFSTKKKDAKTDHYWKSAGYFSSITNALKSLADYEVRGTGLKDFEAVCKKQEELHRLIDSIKTTK